MSGDQLREILKSNDVNLTRLAEKLSITPQTLNSRLNAKTIKDGFIEELERILQLRLLPYKVDFLNDSKRSEVIPVPEGDYMMVEYVDLRASAGLLGVGDVTQLPDTHKRLVPKEYAKGGFLVVRVDGDSMDDGTKKSLSDGDEVLIYEHVDNHIENLPIRKTLFVITTLNGNVLKQIKEINKEEGYILCHSFNQGYEDFKIKFEDVCQIFIVCKVVNKQISLT